MEYKNYNLLKIKIERFVAFVTIDNPPMNILNIPLALEFGRFMDEAANDDDVKVIVFDSADPDFFFAHFDIGHLIDERIFPRKETPRAKELDGWKKTMVEYRSLPKVTIAKVEGIVGGGGNELITGLDMRFGSKEKAFFYQPEGILGILPGGGGTQHLTHLTGRSRSLEIILGCDRFSADMAERYGMINRSIPQNEITEFVNELAFRIALLPSETIKYIKQSVIAAEELSLTEGYIEEGYLFNKCMALSESHRIMKNYMEMGGQTREIETDPKKQFELLEKIIKQK